MMIFGLKTENIIYLVLVHHFKKNRWTDGRTDAGMDRQIDGWMDEG